MGVWSPLSPRRLLVVFFSILATSTASSASDPTRFEFTRPAMGMPVRITLYAPDRAAADAAADAAFKRIKELNAILSDYEPDSELSLLSKTSGGGETVPLSPDLWTVLSRAQELSRRSDGAFDVTVGPAVWLWRKARVVRKLPDPAALAEAMKAVGWRKIVLDPQKRAAKLLVPNMRLDLGAIAKGYAADEALAALRRRGVTRALVAAGGDMALGDPPPGKPGWRIAVASLEMAEDDVCGHAWRPQPQGANAQDPPHFIIASRCSLATSGDLFQHVEIDGKRYSHIVDPRTGIGLTDHSLVVVIARDGIAADGLATTVSVLGPRAGLKLIEATAGAEAFVARKLSDKTEWFESKGFRRFREKASSLP
ncbi:MAG: FAD:protein FMN transferase [Verrucomicrobiae bacterium]|nr:FAD:protein FMN transferase [Verrucomicrobiae bacterium]